MENNHDLRNYKCYPVHHRWVVNKEKLNIFSNVPIFVDDTITFMGSTYTVRVASLADKASSIYVESDEHPYITTVTHYYELLIN